MSQPARRTVIVFGAALATGALVSAVAAEPAAAAREPAPVASCSEALDGFTLGWLPAGLGPLVSDFEYDWNGVVFRNRVWERGPDPVDGYQVDLRVKVLRSDRLTDPGALRTFLAEYHEIDPATWPLEPYLDGDRHGFAEPGRVLFLVEPGTAIELEAEPARVDQPSLLRAAGAIRACG